MSSRPRKALLPALAVAASLALSACGSAHSKVTGGTYAGESGANAPYLDVGPLSYEVQLSRELNPSDTEDASYLQGLSPLQRTLTPEQEWFAVFVQVYNHTSSAQPASSSLTISDTQGNVYSPLQAAAANQFAYRGGLVAANGRLPEPNSTAAAGSTQGALLLYKIKIVSLDNRPLKVTITDPSDPTVRASAELDV
jgi:hypothetical protein